MSIKVTTHVWETSKQRGTKLLMLLAIADNANEHGLAWPGIDTLAHKTRVSPRNAQKTIRALQRDGELIVEERPGTSNYYIIPVTDELRERAKSEAEALQGGELGDRGGVNAATPPVDTVDNAGGRTGVHPRGELGDGGGVNWVTPEPSLNRHLNDSDVSNDTCADAPATADSDTPTIERYQTIQRRRTLVATLVRLSSEWEANEEKRKEKSKAVNALLTAHVEASGEIVADPARVYANKTRRAQAEALYEAGITPQNIRDFIADRRQDDFWQDKTISLPYIAKSIRPWLDSRDAIDSDPAYQPYTPPPVTRNEDNLAKMRALKEKVLANVTPGGAS